MNAFVVPRLAWPSDAELVMPGSKSVANRMLVGAALRGGETTLVDLTPSDDIARMIDGLRTLGFAVAFDAAAERAVVGARRSDARHSGELFCGNAGTALRFLVSVAAITPGEWTLTGDAAMRRRPIAPLVAAWRQLGVDISDTNGCPPVRVRGSGAVRGGAVRLDASVSSQFVSSLLLVGAWLRDGIDVSWTGELASAAYVQLTCDVLDRFGVRTTQRADGVHVEPGCKSEAIAMNVDGDWSSMGTWTCLNRLTGSCVTAPNLRARHADERLGELLRAVPPSGEHTIDVGAMPDQFMNLAIVAAHRAGTTRLAGARNLRVKESDRVAVMARELKKVGADVDELPDGLVIRGGRALRPATIVPENDHRVAMAFALAGLMSPGIAIADPDCVAKSYPRFWRDLERVVAQRRDVAVIGMRGAGKSTFARAFAAATGAQLADLDELFAAQHGAIAAFVAQHGWPVFREHEERLFASALGRGPGMVLATGGGAIESERTRGLLRTMCVVWLDAHPELLRARLAEAPHDRPSLTGAPVADEIRGVLARRQPLYEQTAHVRVDAALPVAAQVELALRELGASCRWPGANTPD